MKVVKNVFVLFLVFAMIISGAGCSASGETAIDEPEATEHEVEVDEPSEEESGGIEVDKGLFNVEITLPAAFVGEDVEQSMEDMRADGKEDVILNNDGSVSFKMSKADHKRMMAELHEEYSAGFDALADDEDYESLVSVKYNDEFTKFDVFVDQEKYENSMFDGLVIFYLGLTGSFYNVFNGTIEDTIEINIINAETEDVFHTATFPEENNETKSAQDLEPKDMLDEIDSFLTSDIWNDGFCEID